jgi:beta-galactosidase
LGEDVVLFTTDGDAESFMRCGVVDGVYPTVDFGTTDQQGVQNAFAVQRNHLPNGGPSVNSEYYPGWFDQWGGKHASVDSKSTTDTIRYMWAMNASFNMYMFYGGTNYEYWAGAEAGPPFITITTSYDYDAPLSEAGDPTNKYDDLRTTMIELTQNPNPEPVPPATNKTAYGDVELEPIGTIFDLLDELSAGEKWSRFPLTMEQLNFGFGFVMYETTLLNLTKTLNFGGSIRDRAHVIIDGRLFKIIDREFSPDVSLDISSVAVKNSKLQILLENRGRICYGSELNDSKGIVGNITNEYGQTLIDWKHSLIDLSQLNVTGAAIRKSESKSPAQSYLPTFYAGVLNVPNPTDTFLDTRGWSKGQALVNGRNLGRYWPARGPQMTLFVPQPYLSSPTSQVVLFELDKPGNCANDGRCRISFTNEHVLGD